jgi:2-keto-4-pentenoate hydratase/2-oxohepta-3-ene-1,7-dioic acid hydratase in catechol pathway
LRWIRFSAAGRLSWGLQEGHHVSEIIGDPFTSWRRCNKTLSLSEVKVEIPLIPRTFYCAGLNYRRHIEEAAAASGKPAIFPQKPDVGYRAQSALISHDEEVVIPRTASEQIQYEGELVVVIGKKAKNISEAEALSCVFGYTIGNDVSERSWQNEDRTNWRSKNADTFKPMGPLIETQVDLDAMSTTVRVNEVVRTQFRTNDMIFSIRRYISTITRYVTLWPGDVIWMGTDGTSPNIKAGDVVEVEISGIGTLRNRFVAEP